MNKGTSEGTVEETNLVKLLNKDKKHLTWSGMGLGECHDCYAIYVIKNAYSEFLGRSIKPKSDVYIAKGHVDEAYLINRDYLLDENDLERFNLIGIDNTGISVKRIDSKRYQILKTSPSTFEKMIGSLELAAGASLFCRNESELYKNYKVIKGWGVTVERFIKYFSQYISEINELFDDSRPQNQILVSVKVKSFSNNMIHNIITTDQIISGRVFSGTGLYKEPYVAHWLYEGGVFRENREMPFSVTTGSGRSHGDYTIVIKPISYKKQ